MGVAQSNLFPFSIKRIERLRGEIEQLKLDLDALTAERKRQTQAFARQASKMRKEIRAGEVILASYDRPPGGNSK